MKNPFGYLTAICLFIVSFSVMGQDKGKYTSIDQAMGQPDLVIELQLSDISEKLPSNITMMKNLEIVRLINLPSNYDLDDAFKKLSKLNSVKKIYLYGNKHQKLPKSISKIKSLEFIELNSYLANDLPLIIESLAKLENFNSLSLRSMRLTQVPENITSLKLKYLNLDNNPNLDYETAFKLLSKIKLESLNLSSSSFTTVPQSINQLSSLKRLELELMNENFNIKSTFLILANLPNLEELNIQGNFLGEIDESITKLKKLKLLEIDGNCIEGESFKKLKNRLPNTIIKNEIPC